MRLSMKIREAKKKLPALLEDFRPIHFGAKDEYRDHVINNLIYMIHGYPQTEIEERNFLVLFYEYKERFSGEIESHFSYF
jgi:hypothetical protein